MKAGQIFAGAAGGSALTLFGTGHLFIAIGVLAASGVVAAKRAFSTP